LFHFFPAGKLTFAWSGRKRVRSKADKKIYVVFFQIRDSFRQVESIIFVSLRGRSSGEFYFSVVI